MSEGRDEFYRQLVELGFTPEKTDMDLRLFMEYTIPGGKFEGRVVKLGFEVPTDFPRSPPGGPHISPRLMPLNSGAAHPDRAAESGFGGDWLYLSRPYPNGQWKGKKGVAEYLAYVDHLFITT